MHRIFGDERRSRAVFATLQRSTFPLRDVPVSIEPGGNCSCRRARGILDTYRTYSYDKKSYGFDMREPHGPRNKSPVLPSHRVPAHLARRFHQICLGVTGEILLHEDLTPMHWGVLVAILEEP